jgi:hypothetical protein
VRYIHLNFFMPWISERKRLKCKRQYGMKSVQQLRAEMKEAGGSSGQGKKALEQWVNAMWVDKSLEKV